MTVGQYLAEFNMWKILSLLHQASLGLPFVSMDDQDGAISTKTQPKIKD